MAQIIIKKNGVAVDTSQVTLEKLSQMIQTLNPTEGVGNAAIFMGNGGNPAEYQRDEEDNLTDKWTSDSVAAGELYRDALLAAGEASDVYEVFVASNPKDTAKFAGRVTRGVLAEKIRMALHPEEWQSELPAREKAEAKAKDKGAPDLAI